MRTIKLIAISVGLIFLMSSCYTQLALVQHEGSQKEYSEREDYYYPPSDTLYSDEGTPAIVQNFYNDNPYYSPYFPYDFSFNFGFYDDWWMNDFYFSPWAYYSGFRPFLLYPIPGYVGYDPYYYDYYNSWWWGPSYSVPYGPRPFRKGGSLIRGGQSKRVRLSRTVRNSVGTGPSSFLPTRASGGQVITSRPTAVRKRVSTEDRQRQLTGRAIRKGTVTQSHGKTIVQRGHSSNHRLIIIRRRSTSNKRYFPITSSSTKPRRIVKQTQPKTEPRLKQRVTRNRNTGTYRSHRWAPTRSSGSYRSPSYSAPSRSTFSRPTSVRSSVRSSSRSSSSRSSGSHRAVRRK